MQIKFKKTNARGTATYEAGSEDNPVKYQAKIPMSMLTKGYADLFKKEAKAKYDPMFKEKIKKQMRQQCEGDEQDD